MFPEIPLPIIVVAFGAVVTAIVAIATWAIRTVRRAAIVVAADDIKVDAIAALRTTITAQDGCIESLTRQVESVVAEAKRTKDDLTSQLVKALARIAELENIIHEWTTVEDIRKRKQADRHEALEVRAEAREMAQEAARVG